MSLFSRRCRCSAVIAAGGVSKRMAGADKLFLDIGGSPVLSWAVSALARCERVDELIVVAREDCLERVAQLCSRCAGGKDVCVIVGGDTRLRSVYNGVFAASGRSDLIAVHDGARPFLTDKLLQDTIGAALEYGAAAPAMPIANTVKLVRHCVVAHTLDRDGLYEIQTPQVFKAEIIKVALTSALKNSIAVTDDCAAVEAIGFPVRTVRGERRNIKITTGEDMALAEALAAMGGTKPL
jgi:2-C-methyl-D-erythritol 4-phosphate cytidylyltransferase